MSSGSEVINVVTKISLSLLCRSPYRHLTDFGNIFKAFIGANYLSMPFAMQQSGLMVRNESK